MTRGAALALLAALTACPAPQSTGPRPPPPDRTLQYRDDVHLLQAHNGMRILIMPQPDTNLVEVHLRIQAGAIDDPDGKSGLAHLLEHLTFEIDLPSEGEETGTQALGRAALGHNAWTNYDSTHYWSRGLREALPDLLAIELGRLGLDCSRLSQPVFDREREVVRNEIRERTGTGARLLEFIREAAYPEGHPYRRVIGGDDPQLAAMTREDACSFLAGHYAPANAILIVAGNTTQEEVKAVLNRHLGSLPPRPAPAVRAVPQARLAGKGLRRSLAVEEATALAVFELPPTFDLDNVAASFIQETFQSQLARAAAEIDWITETEVLRAGGERAPVMIAGVAVDDPRKLPEAARFIDAQARKVREQVDGLELFLIRERRRTTLLQQAERLSSRAAMFADYLQFDRSNQFVVGDLERLKALTADKVKRVSQRVLARHAMVYINPSPDAVYTERRADLTFSPSSHGEAPRSLQVDAREAEQPLTLAATRGSRVSASSFVLDNGLHVMLQPSSSLPLLDIRLIFRAGTAADPPGKPGVAELTAYLLTPTLSDLNDLIELYDFYRMGGDIETSVTADATILRVTGVSMYLDGLVHGLAAIARHGRHDEKTLVRVRNTVATLIEKPDARRQRKGLTIVERALYGHGHPYARAGERTGAAVRAIERDDLARFKERYYVPANATLVIGGQFDTGQMEQHIRHAFATWSSGQPGAAGVREAARAHAVIAGVDNDDATQVSVMLAYPTGAGVDRDHAARLVLVAMLDDRLYAVVRERLAASYGVTADHEARVGPGLLTVTGAIDAARGGEALIAIRQVIAGLRDRDSQFIGDFVRARRTVAQRLLADATDSRSLAAELALAAQYGVDPAYFSSLVDRVARLKPAEVAALAARELAAGRETLIVAGDRPAVEAAFKAAGLPPPKFVR